jgi:hypothetical protein
MTAPAPPNAAGLYRSVTALLVVVTCAISCARVFRTERVYDPSMYRPDTATAVAAELLPLAADGPLGALPLVAAGAERWGQVRPDETRGPWPHRRPEPTPTFGANDRSRWATVRALVDEGTFAIGRRIDPRTGEYPEGYFDPASRRYQESFKDYRDVGIAFEEGWTTIDKVMDPRTGYFYSSKPPLEPTILAGEYWVLKHLFGLSITTDRWVVIPVILITVNVLPFAVYLLVLGRLLERLGETDWARVFVVTTACFGTFLTTFIVSLNNHTPAACTTLFAITPLLRPRPNGSGLRVRDGLLSGLFAGLTAALELPALSLVAALAGLLLLWQPRALLGFVPAVLVWVAAELGTNYLALGEWEPAYRKFGGPWYVFPGGYWGHLPTGPRLGIDYAYLQESWRVYLFHVLIGHHGIFSLTPVWLLTLCGLVLAAPAIPRAFRRSEALRGDRPFARGWLALLTAAVSLVVIAFYVAQTDNRNYGGWTAGLRWLFWLTPLWLLTLAPAADRLAVSRWERGLAYALLAVSVFSVTYPMWNPWRHPWLYDLMVHLGWSPY